MSVHVQLFTRDSDPSRYNMSHLCHLRSTIYLDRSTGAGEKLIHAW